VAYLRENASTLLESTTGISLNAADTHDLFTVPPGKTAWITMVILRDLTADTLAAEISLGESGDTDDWAKKLLLGDHLDAADDALVLRPRHWLQASDTWDPGNIADGAEEAHDVTCDDAELGDFAIASFSLDVSDLTLTADVTAANTVTAILSNSTGGAVNLGSGTIRVRVWKFDDGIIQYDAGDVFSIEITTASGAACSCTADVFGYLA
jgi:hypothetical protein